MMMALAWGATAQEASSKPKDDTPKKKSVTVKPYGFIRNYLNYDSRSTYTAVGGEYNMIPYDEKWNSDHTCDLNDVAHIQLQAITTRIGLNLSGPELIGMQSSGRIEADFGGFGTTNTVFRIRHAFVKLSDSRTVTAADGTQRTNTSELLLGQTWHPVGGDIMPDVLGMAAGAPFRPHSRTPQLRYIGYHGNFGYTASLLYQNQYMNNGPKSATDLTSTNSTSYALNAIVPEIFLGLNYRNNGFYAQFGIDAQTIRPRTHAANQDDVVCKVDETVHSLTPTLYMQYVGSKFSVKFRTLLAQNTSHLNQLVGYGVTGYNTVDGSFDYASLKASISYLNLSYGKTYRANLFFGYMQNLGSDEKLYNYDGGYLIYLKGGNNFTRLGGVWRVAPSISYNVKAFNIGLEYEITAAQYGDLNQYGVPVDNLHNVVNHRLCALVKYNF